MSGAGTHPSGRRERIRVADLPYYGTARLIARDGTRTWAVEWDPQMLRWQVQAPDGRVVLELDPVACAPHVPAPRLGESLLDEAPDLAAGGARRERALRRLGQ